MIERATTTLQRLQSDLQTYAQSVQSVNGEEPPLAKSEYSRPVQTMLLKALVAVGECAAPEVQAEIESFVGLIRLYTGYYGSYIDIAPGQLCDGEQTLFFYDSEEGAKRGLERALSYGLQEGRITQLRVATSNLPHAHPQACVKIEDRWAVIVSKDVDRKALLDTMFPGLRKS